MELSEKEAHCVARLIQGAMFGINNTMAGCAFCKFIGDCDKSSVIYRQVQKKLEKETGVDLSDTIPTNVLYSDFPYKKFLKNANENIKEHFRNLFVDI